MPLTMERERKTNVQLARIHLQKLGIPAPQNPGFAEAPQLPDDLTSLSAKDLSRLMARYTASLEYVKYQLALAEVRHQDAKDRATKFAAKEFMRLKDLNPRESVTGINRQVETNATLIRIQEKVAIYDAQQKLLKAVHDGQDGSYKVLSRDLTRRTSAFERDLD